eukprot:7801323-Pyramimonas_sp.AAC.1
MQSLRLAPVARALRPDLAQSPGSAPGFASAAGAAVPCDARVDLRALPRRPTFPILSGTGPGSSNESPCYLAGADLPDGRLAVV